LSSKLTFEPFHVWWTINKGPNRKMEFQKETGFSPQTAAKVWNDRFPVRSDIIDTICETYGLEVHQIIKYKRDIDSKGIND